MSHRQRILALGAATSLLPAAVLLDLLAIPTEPVTILYAIPMLAAALWLAPPAVAVLVAVTLGLSVAARLAHAVNLDGVALLRVTILGIIGLQSYLLAVRIAAVQEREAARRGLQRQLAMVAHDLRTPLTTILAYAQWLSRAELPSEQSAEAAQRIEGQARHMARTVADLADAAQIDVGAMDVQRRPTDMVAVVRQVVEAVQTGAQNHRIELDGPDELAGVWDADRLERVLTNLLTNSVKYSPAGSEIRVRIWREEGSAFVSVSDRGRGMRRDQLSGLFQPFSRTSMESETPGTGLGLYICRGIVRAHGGEIWATSPGPERGSTFTFRLPLQPSSRRARTT